MTAAMIPFVVLATRERPSPITAFVMFCIWLVLFIAISSLGNYFERAARTRISANAYIAQMRELFPCKDARVTYCYHIPACSVEEAGR